MTAAALPGVELQSPPDEPRPAGLRRLTELLGAQRWRVLGTALLASATLASGIGLIALAAYLISRSAVVTSTATLALAITGVRFFAVARAALRYVERYVGHVTTFRVLTRLRVWFFRGLEPLAPARLAQRRGGDLLSRILSDIDTLQDFALRVAVPALGALLTTALAGAVLGSFSVVLGFVVVAYLVATGVVLPAVTRWIGKEAAGELAAARAHLEAEAVESMTGLAELVAMGREDRLIDNVGSDTMALCRIDCRLARLRGLGNGVGALLVGLAAMTLLALATPMVRSGHLEGVHLAIVPLVAIAAFESVLPLSAAMEHLGRARSAAARLDDLIGDEPAVTDPASPATPPLSAAPRVGIEIVFDAVTFSYDPSMAPALHDVTMRIPAGSHVAVVGPSGSGKSTLVSLLLRFWDYRSGGIRAGGTELHDLSAENARALVATVQQKDHLFDTTVRDNLLLADPDADDVRITAALEAAAARQFVDGLPYGLDSRVGEDGANLSGGERQRLMIARALLAEAPLLVLDEATAHLDGPTEAAVLAGVRRWQGERTTVTISHRELPASHADIVYRLDRGRCEMISHDRRSAS